MATDKTERQLALNAIERDSLSQDRRIAARADRVFLSVISGKASAATIKRYASREREYQGLSA